MSLHIVSHLRLALSSQCPTEWKGSASSEPATSAHNTPHEHWTYKMLHCLLDPELQQKASLWGVTLLCCLRQLSREDSLEQSRSKHDGQVFQSHEIHCTVGCHLKQESRQELKKVLMGFGQAAEQLSQVLYAFCCVDFVLWGGKKTNPNL